MTWLIRKICCKWNQDKKSYRNIFIYHIGYMKVKDLRYSTIISVNPSCVIMDKINAYIEESNGNNTWCWFLLMKARTLWGQVRGNNWGNCDENCMKVKFNPDSNLSLNKMLKLHNVTIVVRSVFHEGNKYYPKVFLCECLYKL